MTATSTSLDGAKLREVLGHYPTGVVLVTGTAADGERLAMIVGTFTSVSLEPALVAFLPMRSSGTFARLRECESLCINILSGDQEEVCRTIVARREDKFRDLDWFPSPSGDPVLAGSVAWLDVRLTDTIEAGDHWIAMCTVRDMAIHNPVSPLIFFQRGYGTFIMPSLVARIDDGIIGAVQSAAVARNDLQELADGIHCEVALLTAVNCNELAAVAAAAGPGINVGDGLADRVPMVPPIGDTYMAYAPQAEQEAWFSHTRGAPEEFVRICRERLELCREQGYLIALLPDEDVATAYSDFYTAARMYGSGLVTPEQQRQLEQRLQNSVVDYSPHELVPEATYHPGSIVVPLRDSAGEMTLTLRVSQLPAVASGAQIQEWIRAALATAARISDRLAAGVPG
ncbi:flavin reductase family protein [Granulicoccus phenolivorans]|uniref:flavin reductase family protein n=1 Tax=Granulicoccus phenolivorans TaxID=266854 RepID=UPI000425DD05|nr:flavin reductase family protein [Granulicoccus phenolivorans]